VQALGAFLGFSFPFFSLRVVARQQQGWQASWPL